jgi:hypothetical protein
MSPVTLICNHSEGKQVMWKGESRAEIDIIQVIIAS